MFGNKIIEKPEKKDLKRPLRNKRDVENEESPSKKSKSIKIVGLKDWKPPKQMESWSTSMQIRDMTITMPKELFEKNTLVFEKYKSVLNNDIQFRFGSRILLHIHQWTDISRRNRWHANACSLIQKALTTAEFAAISEPNRDKIEVFKASILINKIDGVRRYFEALEMMLGYYVSRNMKMLYHVLQHLFKIDSRPAQNTFRYFGFNCKSGAFRQNKPISNYEDLSNLFREEYAIRNNLNFDLCAYFSIIERTNYVFPRKLQLLSKEVRRLRNELAHNFGTDFWTDEKCDISIVKIDKFCQEVSLQIVKECSKSIGTRCMEIANSVPSFHIKRDRYQSLLEQYKFFEEAFTLPYYWREYCIDMKCYIDPFGNM